MLLRSPSLRSWRLIVSPYVATASTSYPKDFMEKVAKAKAMKGTKVIHIMAPCPTGWGYPAEKTIEIGKMAVECGPVVSGRV